MIGAHPFFALIICIGIGIQYVVKAGLVDFAFETQTCGYLGLAGEVNIGAIPVSETPVARPVKCGWRDSFIGPVFSYG